jgi:NitT/TauT family transport system substrate-binding protein
MNEWVGFAPLFLARDLGYYEPLPVEFSFVASEGDKRAGLYARRFDVICETVDMFETNRDRADFPGKLIFALDESYGGDGVVASQQITSVRDLRRKTVVAEPGQPAYFALQYVLDQQGMTLADIQVQQMDSADAASAFIAKSAEAAGTYEPYLSRCLQKRPGAHLLVSSRDLAGLIVDIAVVRQETLDMRRKDMETVFRAWCRAMEYVQEHRADAVQRMAKIFKLSPQEFEVAIKGLRYLDAGENRRLFETDGQPGGLPSIFETVGKILKANHITSVTVGADSRVDASVVLSVLRKQNTN